MIQWFKQAEDWQKGLTIGSVSWLVLALCCLALGGVKAFLIMLLVYALIGVIGTFIHWID